MKGKARSQNILHIYRPIKKSYKSHKGLSERLIKKNLIDSGYEVWRGGFIHATRLEDPYPNVKKKYSRLLSLLSLHHPGKAEHLQYLSSTQKGMPDFIVFRDGFKFVECKLGHEQLSKRQKLCIERLNSLGFPTEVHKIVFPSTLTRKARVDIFTGEKQVIERQERLRKNYSKVK